MRIIAGHNKGRRLASVGSGDQAAQLRPTTDRARESLFNILAGGKFGDALPEAYVLDLFAGTGALGLEALSRGAERATFVENGRKAQSILAENIVLCAATDTTDTIRRDATRLGLWAGKPHTLVFLDPPYNKKLGEKALASAIDGGWIAKNALIVWEEGGPITPPAGLVILDQRAMRGTVLSFLEYRGA